MAAVITQNTGEVRITGVFEYTCGASTTDTVIDYSAGDAPAATHVGRLIVWVNTAVSGLWEVRKIASIASNDVTVDDPFSAAPSSGDTFRIMSTAQDLVDAFPSSVTKNGNSFYFVDELAMRSNACFGSLNESIILGGGIDVRSGDRNTIFQMGVLVGGENNNSTETKDGGYLRFDGLPFFGVTDGTYSNGFMVNLYGTTLDSDPALGSIHTKHNGPLRLVNFLMDCPVGFVPYNDYSEYYNCIFAGIISGNTAGSVRTIMTRPIEKCTWFQNAVAIKSYQTYAAVYRDCTFSDSNTDILEAGGTAIQTFIDCSEWGDDKYLSTTADARHYKSANYRSTEVDGTPIVGALLAIYDKNDLLQEAVRTSDASGICAETLAWRRQWDAGGPEVTFFPFTTRFRKYGFKFQEFSSDYDNPVAQDARLAVNSVTVLSEAAAAALTGIAIDFVTEDVTITTSHTLSEIYDYCQSQLALSASMDELEFLTSSDGVSFQFLDDWNIVLGSGGMITGSSSVTFSGTGEIRLTDAANTIDGLTANQISVEALVVTITDVVSGGSLDFTTAGTYILDGCTIEEVTNSSGGAVVIYLSNGATVTTNTGPSTTISNAGATVTFDNLTSANVQIVEDDTVTVNQRSTAQTGTLVYNTPNGSSGSWCYIINREGYDPIMGTFTADGSDMSVDATQTQKQLSDGSAMYQGTTSAFISVVPSADGSRMFLRISDGSVSAQACFDEAEDALMTQDGMTYLCNGGGQVDIALLATGQYVTLKTNVRVIRDTAPDANATIAAFVSSTDGTVLDNTNGAVQFVTPNSDVNIVSVNGTSTTNIDDFKLTASEVWSDPITVAAGTQGLYNTIAGGILVDTTVTGTPTTTEVQLTAGSTIDDFYNDQLVQFLSGTGVGQIRVITDYVGATKTITVDEVFVTTPIATDRVIIKSDHVHPVTQIQAGLATSAEIAALNDFDPATDAVANVTTVATNTDMRGTDGANTVSPATPANVTDAQTAIIAEVDALNDFNPAVDVVANVTLVDTTTTNTDMVSEPDNASITAILADTNELQTNQGSWVTADVSAIETKAQADARQALLIAEHDATQATLAALNNFDPSTEEVTTNTASRDASKADLTTVEANQAIINVGVQDASLLIPHGTDL